MIEVKNLHIFHKDNEILSDICFKVFPGDLVALIGPNGSGKTTLIKTLVGMHSDITGEIYLDGKHISSFRGTEISRKVSVVLTQKIQTPLRVSEVLATGRFPYANRLDLLKKHDRQLILETAVNLKINHLLERSIHLLSDGERQRVMIGRALIQQTPVLLLDEPDTHLDIKHRAVLLKILKEITAQGKTVLFSTHYLDLFFDLVDKVFLLHDGNLFEGSPESPETLNMIDRVFTNDLVIFDKKNKQFKIK